MTEVERDALPNFTQIYSELEKARENLNRRYLNNNDQSAGRSSRAIFSAMCLLDTARAELLSTSSAVRGMREAAQSVIEQAQTSVTDHEGRQHAMVDDRGEVLYLVQFEAIEQLRAALSLVEGEDKPSE